MRLETRSPANLRFGTFEVDLRAGELRKQGLRVKLQDQPFQVLIVLLERPGELVTREELRKQIWPEDTFVDFDNSLNTAINKLREALGDSADSPRFIETLPRRGYRFVAPVNGEAAKTPATSPAPRNKVGALPIVAVMLVATAAGGWLWLSHRNRVPSPQAQVAQGLWSSGAAMPKALKFPAVGVIRGKIYVVGGVNTTVDATNQVYDTVADNWTTATKMPVATFAAASAVIGDVLYIFGGQKGNLPGTTVTNRVWAYDPRTDTWSQKANMPTARSSAGAAVTRNLIYVIGGYNGSRVRTVESYDPASDTWTVRAPLLVGKSEPSVGVVDNRIVAADGLSNDGATGDNEVYDPDTNTWASLTADPIPRDGNCTGVIGGQLYIAGAWNGRNSASGLSGSFDLKTNTWMAQQPIPLTVVAPGSAVYDGKLYCFGGGDVGQPFTWTGYTNVQIFRPY